MKQIVFSNWSIIRFLRLVAGVAILVQAAVASDLLFAMLGVLFVAMPLFNVGCCGASGCAVPPQKNTGEKKEIRYEEVV